MHLFQRILGAVSSVIFLILSILIIFSEMSDRQKLLILLLMIAYTCLKIVNLGLENWQGKNQKIDKDL